VEVFAWIEQTPVGLWVREAPTIWAFPFVLLLHTIGLGIVAGTAVVLNAYAYRHPEQWAAHRLEPYFRFAWAGFAVNLVSGLLLLAAYPAKALTDPVFYLKIGCVIVAMAQLRDRCVRLLDRSGRRRSSARVYVPLPHGRRYGDLLIGRMAAWTTS
jgi:hypothetical protein